MSTKTTEVTTTPLLQEIKQQAVVLTREAHGPVTVKHNRYGGFDLTDKSGRCVRIAQEDPECAAEIYVLDPQGWLITDARFGGGFPAPLIAAVVRDAFSLH